MDRFVTFEDFASYLETNKVRHNIDREARVVELAVNAPPLPTSIFVKWERALPIFTFVQMMIDKVPVERISDLESAIVRLNTSMEIGGFSYDYQRNRLFARFSVPLFAPEGITPASFQKTFQLVVANARGFVPIFQKVIAGAKGADIEQIVKDHAAQMKAQAAAAATPVS
ncbi:MAG: hypothetical protein AB7L94_41765 [Kofleriaceae bacterium]